MAEGELWLRGYREGGVEPSSPCAYGTYYFTGLGTVESWAQVAARVFELVNGDGGRVAPVSIAEYYASVEGPIALRLEHFAFDLSKIETAGFAPCEQTERLAEYTRARQPFPYSKTLRSIA